MKTGLIQKNEEKINSEWEKNNTFRKMEKRINSPK